MRSLLKPIQLLATILLVLGCLTGCIRYDVGINYNHENQGQIVQHIQLSDRILNFSQAVAEGWLTQIAERAEGLEGRSDRLNKREIQVTIPFQSSHDLQKKFNQLLQPLQPQLEAQSTIADLTGSFQVRERNFLLVAQHQLSLDLDLRNLGVTSTGTDAGINPSTILDLKFQLQASGGVQPAKGVANAPSIQRKTWNRVTWQLQPGHINRIEANLWVPNPVGLGTVVIVGVLALGIRLQHASKQQSLTVDG